MARAGTSRGSLDERLPANHRIAGFEEKAGETMDAITAVCSGCGRMVYAVVNKPDALDKEHDKTVTQLVRDGYNIVQKTVEDVRAADWTCECKEKESK